MSAVENAEQNEVRFFFDDGHRCIVRIPSAELSNENLNKVKFATDEAKRRWPTLPWDGQFTTEVCRAGHPAGD